MNRQQRTMAWQHHGLVLAPREPWEGRFIQNFTCCAEPLEDERWRLWYSVNGPGAPFNVAIAEGVVGEPMTRHAAVLSAGEPADAPLAIGNLPEGWRPVQPVHLRLHDGRHRLYFWAHGPDVVRYLIAESDDGRRYRVLDPHRPALWHPNDRAASGFGVAGAGLTAARRAPASRPADEPPADPACTCNDATNVYQLPDGSFELYSVGLVEVAQDDARYMAEDNAAGLVRVIDRWTSADGLRWGDRQRVLEPDADDPPGLQFYHLAVTHTPRGRVGLLGHYRADLQTMDLEWCTSHDGISWQRPARRAWLERRAGEPDSWGIYPPHAMVERDERWWLFYTGVNFAHNRRAGADEPRSVIMAASTRSLGPETPDQPPPL